MIIAATANTPTIDANNLITNAVPSKVPVLSFFITSSFIITSSNPKPVKVAIRDIRDSP